MKVSGALTLAFGMTTAAVAAWLPSDVTKLSTSAPAAIAEFDAAKLGGEPWRLAWSPDGTELFLQIGRGERFGKAEIRNYLLAVSGGPPVSVALEPEWASVYWVWKSGYASPGMPKFRMQTTERKEPFRSPVPGRPGDGVPGVKTAPTAGNDDGKEIRGQDEPGEETIVRTLQLNDERLAETVNEEIAAGVSFGWAPAGIHLIAFVRPDGSLWLMDWEGRRVQVPGIRNAQFPAWSQDAGRLAVLEHTGRTRYQLTIVQIKEK